MLLTMVVNHELDIPHNLRVAAMGLLGHAGHAGVVGVEDAGGLGVKDEWNG